MAALPTGTVTFLFTDVEGSTRLWEQHPDPMRAALARHDVLIEQAVERHGGVVVRPRGEGDSRFAVFARATDAVTAAGAIQRALHAEPWPPEAPLRVRVALHTGEADLRAGDYYGGAVNRAARLRAVAHGGQALLSQATRDLVRDALPGGVAVRDLGAHRLRDLARPERVFQLLAAGAPAAFPPLRSLDARPHNLPRQLTPFVGRAREVAAVAARLRRPDVPLLTLTGPGGVGKTRLALQVAAAALGPAGPAGAPFPDGAWFVDLAPLTDAAGLPAAVAQAVGVREAAGRPVAAALRDHLRAKRLLLVLDNCEHLLPGAAPAVAVLLAAGPGLKALATSREPLRVAGEHEHPVPPLALPPPPDPLHPPGPAALAQSEAAALFVERAVAARPDFAVTAATAPAVAALCRRLDGLPLALELAAARVRLLGPDALLGRLSSRLGLLTTGARDVPARHQTLRAAIEWSYELLTSAEQRLFERLAVFVGGCTLDAAEAVANADGRLGTGVLDGMGALLDKSLLRRLDGLSGEPRFGLLETIREYAAERLTASGHELGTRERHAAYFLALAEADNPDLLVGPQLVASLGRLEREHDNLRAALRWCLQHNAAQAVRLCRALWRFWETHGHLAEGRERLSEVLRVTEATEAALPSGQGKAMRAALLTAAGVLARAQGDSAGARALHDQALALRREVGDRRGVAISLNNLGVLDEDRGDYALARSRYHESLAILRDVADPSEIRSRSLRYLGSVATKLGDHTVARSLYEESLALSEQLGNRRGIAYALNSLGNLDQLEGHHEPARASYERSLAIGVELGDRRSIAYSLEGLAGLAAAGGQPGRAFRLAGAAAGSRASIGAAPSVVEEERLRRWLRPAAQTLSAQARASSWARGQAMPLEQALAFALEDAPTPAADPT